MQNTFNFPAPGDRVIGELSKTGTVTKRSVRIALVKHDTGEVRRYRPEDLKPEYDDNLNEAYRIHDIEDARRMAIDEDIERTEHLEDVAIAHLVVAIADVIGGVGFPRADERHSALRTKLGDVERLNPLMGLISATALYIDEYQRYGTGETSILEEAHAVYRASITDN